MAREVGADKWERGLKSFSALQVDGREGRVAVSWIVAIVVVGGWFGGCVWKDFRA